ncbi:hypothetical protein [Sinomicrobium weinanense]|uniref:Uncharacterized protein n=1 Tax=Sinomicrobium weinanense TaxID=2842200 RepID=A0A926Q521_9FLAO|nr:hypothetical protein [Sinomicrobium weinanense]MBC9797500.1 hypothetical protein [Sinomicrobium weinanense]MBU3122214.1 hypothetical protein [Sinomicrobium weinanense]
MKINNLKQRPHLTKNTKTEKTYLQFEKLLSELRKRELPAEIVNSVNKDIEEINSIPGDGNPLKKTIGKKQNGIIKLIEKKIKLVPKKHYLNLWLPLGMAVFGIPIGIIFGISMGNMAFLGVGLPVGMVLGIAIGTELDKKAFEEGRQLDLEVN